MSTPQRFSISSQKGFAHLLLVPAVLILLVVIILATHLPEKMSGAPHPNAPLVSASNQGIIPNRPQTNYKNNLAVNWVPVDWTKVISAPRQQGQFPPLDQNTSVYSVQDITYCNAGDTKLKLDLYSNKPTVPGENKPIIVYIFGGGLLDGDKRMMYGTADHLLLTLVNDGFIVAAPNYRLAPKYKFPAMIQDVLCSIRFLKYYAYGIGGDQNKIGMHGESVGGQLDELAGITSGTETFENSEGENIAGSNLTYHDYLKIPIKPQAVVTYYGGGELPDNPIILFLVEHMISLLPGAPTAWHDTIPGSGDKTYSQTDIFKDVYNSDTTLTHEASAFNYVTKDEPPFLIIQGEKDMLAPPQQAADLYAKLKSFNNNVQLVVVKNADHGFVPNPPNATIDPDFETITGTTVNFFKTHLK